MGLWLQHAVVGLRTRFSLHLPLHVFQKASFAAVERLTVEAVRPLSLFISFSSALDVMGMEDSERLVRTSGRNFVLITKSWSQRL